MLNPFRSHVARDGHHDTAEATLAALVNPSAATTQREAFRKSTKAAMFQQFHRGTAPVKDAMAEVLGAVEDHPVVMVNGVLLSDSLEKIQDPEAVAATVEQIIAKHRAESR